MLWLSKMLMVRYDEELIASREFGDEEDARKRRMHHTRHNACHTHEREVLLGHVDTYLVGIPEAGEEETRKTADKERRGEGSTTTATAIGCRCGKHLGEGDESDIDEQQMAVAIEERVAHHLPPLYLCSALEQDVDSRVALAIERREQEDKAAQDESAQGVWHKDACPDGRTCPRKPTWCA